MEHSPAAGQPPIDWPSPVLSMVSLQNYRFRALATGSSSVTPRVTKLLIKLLKMQLSREDQTIKVSNQNFNYQDFKFEVSKCYLVWTDMLSQQIFRIDRSQIRPHS
jgi:hypothetical protein